MAPRMRLLRPMALAAMLGVAATLVLAFVFFRPKAGNGSGGGIEENPPVKEKSKHEPHAPTKPEPEKIEENPPVKEKSKPLPPPPPMERTWTAGVGRVQVKQTDADGRPWDASGFLDGPLPDLFVEIERSEAVLKARVKELDDRRRPLAHRLAMRSVIPLKERHLATLAPGDPLHAKRKKELADFKKSYPPMSDEDLERMARLGQEASETRARFLHRTRTAKDTTLAVFETGAVPVKAGDTLEIGVWDSDFFGAQRVGKSRLVVTRAMLDKGVADLPAFEQVVGLRLHFRKAR